MSRKFGYCCINLSLSEGVSKKNRVTTNRSMVKRTFLERGIGYASDLALQNVLDLKKIIQWNSENDILMYRMSSDMFPWFSEYEISDLPDFEEISKVLKECGDLAMSTNQRITFHPSPYSVLASLREDVVKKSFKELRQHSEIMDLMGLPANHYYPINIHVNTTQPSKEEAAARFCENFLELNESTKKRLVVEIDDKKSQYTSVDLKSMVYDVVGVPITFDYLHNLCNPPEGLTERESLKICLDTWPSGITPLTHFSESRSLFEDGSAKDLAHSDWIHQRIETYGFDFDIELEVKMKDKALLDYHHNIEQILCLGS
jgi:UV DNA damage endonuclease